MAGSENTATEYIHHHLTHWQINLATGHMGGGMSGFWVLNLDTLIISIIVGAVFIGLFRWAAVKASSGTPGAWQNVVEMMVEFADGITKDTFEGQNRLIAPLGLTIFMWVFLINALDLVPVDLFPDVAKAAGVPYLKIVPTNDLNFTFAMSLSVFALVLFYSIKVKGPVGYIKELLLHPFGVWLAPFNFLLNIVELLAKPLSLSLRLFGNMFAAEFVFVIVALLPFWAQWVPGSMWSIYHLIVVPLQAFIFMVLTIVYLSLAHQHDH